MSRRGITLVELMIVTALLVIFASLSAPKLFVIRDSVSAQALLIDLRRTLDDAASRARTSGEPVAMRIDQNSGVTLATTDGQGNETVFETTPLPAGVQVAATRLNDSDVAQDEWVAKVFPDGQSTSAELEVTTATGTLCLKRDVDGKPSWRTGKLVDQPDGRWEAGEIEKRFSN